MKISFLKNIRLSNSSPISFGLVASLSPLTSSLLP